MSYVITREIPRVIMYPYHRAEGAWTAVETGQILAAHFSSPSCLSLIVADQQDCRRRTGYHIGYHIGYHAGYHTGCHSSARSQAVASSGSGLRIGPGAPSGFERRSDSARKAVVDLGIVACTVTAGSPARIDSFGRAFGCNWPSGDVDRPGARPLVLDRACPNRRRPEDGHLRNMKLVQSEI